MNIYIKTTEQCNLHCLHCYNPANKTYLDFNKIKNSLDCITNKKNDDWFIFHGGEPMLGDNKKMLNLIKYFPDKNWRISTNLCYTLTNERLNILKHMKEVRVSFDCGIRFNNIYTLLLWLKNMKILSKLRISLFINFSFTKDLIKHDPIDIIKLVRAFGIKRYAFERITLVGNAKKNAWIIPSYEEIDNWLCKLYDTDKYDECIEIENIKLGINGEKINTYGPGCCHNTITINADGTIGNCPNDAVVNSISSLDAGIDNAISNIKCKKHLPKQACLICDYFKYCHGWCEQMKWQGTTCPYPKRLADKILGDNR